MTEQTTDAELTLLRGGLFPWWVLLLWGILAIVLGFMFLSSPGITTELLITFMGAFWLIGGLFSIASLFVDRTNMGWKLFLAVIDIIAGILILTYPLYSTVFILGFFVIFIGFYACFIGGSYLFQAFKTKDWGNGVLGVISLIFGILLLLRPLLMAGMLPFIAGIFCFLGGFSAIISSFMIKKVQVKA